MKLLVRNSSGYITEEAKRLIRHALLATGSHRITNGSINVRIIKARNPSGATRYGRERMGQNVVHCLTVSLPMPLTGDTLAGEQLETMWRRIRCAALLASGVAWNDLNDDQKDMRGPIPQEAYALAPRRSDRALEQQDRNSPEARRLANARRIAHAEAKLQAWERNLAKAQQRCQHWKRKISALKVGARRAGLPRNHDPNSYDAEAFAKAKQDFETAIDSFE